jgi:hypothetical protein
MPVSRGQVRDGTLRRASRLKILEGPFDEV